jgi:SAM-dependent methyltransferase
MTTTGPDGLARRRVRAVLRRGFNAIDRRVFPASTVPSEHWQRIVLNRAIDEHIASLDPASRTAAEISGDTHAGKPWKSYTKLDYPDFDICAPLPDDRRFDVVICEQVLEHVPDPCAAAQNLRGLCAPGGHVIVSTPFLVKIHELASLRLEDYWRFTPRGLRTLLERAGLRVDEVGTWGNRLCVTGNLSRWAGHRRWHPMGNEADVPVQVWAFARNPR